MIKLNSNEVAQQLTDAMKSGDENEILKAWEGFHESLTAQLKADAQDVVDSNDATILAQRGYRQLTSKEKRWYEKLIEALKSPDPKQAFTTILGGDDEDKIMPSTIIEDVFRDLERDYPILSTIDFQDVRYLTRWLLNKNTRQKAVWGKITAAITQEITSSFEVIDVAQNKLTAYAFIEIGMLDLGPTFLDAYIRACLFESLSYGLEDGIVNGNGKDQPVGMVRDIHEGVSFDTGTGYPEKSAVKITEFTPVTYGGAIAPLVVTEKGAPRRGITKVHMAVNLKTYLTKLLPATKVLAASGKYESYLDSIFPTEIVMCDSVADDRAILYIGREYHMYAGGPRRGVIEYSDDFKFLDDVRYFKVRLYGNGRATDNTCTVVLDVSDLAPIALPVNVVNTVKTEAAEAV